MNKKNDCRKFNFNNFNFNNTFSKEFYNKIFFIFFFSFFFLIIFSFNSYSIGVSCGATYSNYEPFKKIPFEFQIFRANQGYSYSVEGTFKDYVRIEEKNDDYIRGYIVLPPFYTNPGRHRTALVFTEKNSNSNGNAVAVTAIRCPFYVDVPYPGKYLLFNFNVKNINVGEKNNLSYHLENKGKEKIENLHLTFKILKNNVSLKEYEVLIKELNSSQILNKKLLLDTEFLKPGYYDVLGYAFYDEENLSLYKKFRVGDLDVNVLNSTRVVLQNNFLKLNFTVENNWNKKIKNVYLIYYIKNDVFEFKKMKTISIDLDPFEVKTFENIYEAQGILPGDYFIHYELYFSDNKKEGVFPLKVVKPKSDFYTVILVVSLLFSTIFLFLLFIFLRKNKNNKRIIKNKIKSYNNKKNNKSKTSKK